MTPLEVLDWRRRIAELYARIRGGAAASAAAMHAEWRETRQSLFRHHPASPLQNWPATARASISIPGFPYDPTWRITAELRPAAVPSAPFHCTLGADGALEMTHIGDTVGLEARCGTELPIYSMAGYGGGIYIAFADTHAATYGGGRYVYDTRKGADLGQENGRLVLDFNFAFSPSCAWSTDYVCPLAPPEARLPVEVAAGEVAPPALR